VPRRVSGYLSQSVQGYHLFSITVDEILHALYGSYLLPVLRIITSQGELTMMNGGVS
jgi:hypothetical protein